MVAQGRERELAQLVADWWAAREQLGEPGGVAMLAHRREDMRELNGRGRALMRAAGRLGEVELQVGNTAFITPGRSTRNRACISLRG